MKIWWNKYIAWFDARVQRERAILAAAVIGCILMLGIDHWVWPAFARSHQLSVESSQSAQTIVDLRAQNDRLQLQLANPDAAAKIELERLHAQLAEQEPQIRAVEASLVPASKMPQFLESLLAHSLSLQLVSLKTLPPVPVLNNKITQAVTASNTPTPANITTPTADPAGSLYKHGVEIKVSGSFADLLGYVTDLEQAPQKVIWGHMELTTDYPRSTMVLTVYTLSLDKAWLVI